MLLSYTVVSGCESCFLCFLGRYLLRSFKTPNNPGDAEACSSCGHPPISWNKRRCRGNWRKKTPKKVQHWSIGWTKITLVVWTKIIIYCIEMCKLKNVYLRGQKPWAVPWKPPKHANFQRSRWLQVKAQHWHLCQLSFLKIICQHVCFWISLANLFLLDHLQFGYLKHTIHSKNGLNMVQAIQVESFWTTSAMYKNCTTRKTSCCGLFTSFISLHKGLINWWLSPSLCFFKK